MFEWLFQPLHFTIILVIVLLIFSRGKLSELGGLIGKAINEPGKKFKIVLGCLIILVLFVGFLSGEGQVRQQAPRQIRTRLRVYTRYHHRRTKPYSGLQSQRGRSR